MIVFYKFLFPLVLLSSNLIDNDKKELVLELHINNKNITLNNSYENINTNNDLLFKIISSIDLFLIGIVLLIFGFGVYELFISEIDFAKGKFADSTLKINSLDQLKNKIIKVIIIVLIVKFFEKVLKLSHNFTTPHDLLLFSLSILSICIGYYLINRK